MSISGATKVALPQGDASIPMQSYTGVGVSGTFGDNFPGPCPHGRFPVLWRMRVLLWARQGTAGC